MKVFTHKTIDHPVEEILSITLTADSYKLTGAEFLIFVFKVHIRERNHARNHLEPLKL